MIMDTDLDQPLRLLLLEDNEADAELLIAHLEAQGIHTQAVWVSCRSEYSEALATSSFDLICSDYSIPGFDGLSALEMAQNKCPGVPFIFVSGKLGEEFAIGTLRDGATDYVLKRRLSRLAPAVRRAVAEAEEKRAHAKAQAEILRQKKLIDEALRIGGCCVWHWDLETGRVWASAALGEMAGIESGDIAAERILALRQIVEPEDRPVLESAVRQALATGIRQTVEFRVLIAAGQRTLKATFQDARGPDGQPHEVLGTLEFASAEDGEGASTENAVPRVVLPDNLNQAAAEIFNLSTALDAASGDELRRGMASLRVLCQLFDLTGESRQSADLNVIVESAVAVLERSQLNIVIVPVLSQEPLPIEINAGAVLQFLCQTAQQSAQQVGHRGSMVIQTFPILEAAAPDRALLSVEIRGSSIEADQLRELLAGCGGDSEIIANPPLGSTVRITWPVERFTADRVPSTLAIV